MLEYSIGVLYFPEFKGYYPSERRAADTELKWCYKKGGGFRGPQAGEP